MSAFHFLRPEYLLLLPFAWLLVWLLLQQQDDEKKWQRVIDPKLLKHLLLAPKEEHSKIVAPWHLAGVLTLAIVAVSGPSWKLKASPFAQDDTQIALVMSVKKSMLTSDITPTRLSRAVIKIEDLLARRNDMQSTLLAYAGSAHLALPLTKDAEIIKTFAQALDPGIMPREGDALQDALLLAQSQLKGSGGSIVVLSDAVSPSAVKLAIKKGFDTNTQVIFWQMASKALSPASDFKSAASILDGETVPYANDDSDVKEVASLISQHFKNRQEGEDARYEDGGYYLVPLIFLLLLFWARQGFIAELWRRA